MPNYRIIVLILCLGCQILQAWETDTYATEDTMTSKQIQFDFYHTRLTLAKSNPGKENWLFLAGGPGADSEYFIELVELLNLPGNIWLVDLPENGGNRLGDNYDEHYDFAFWEQAFKHVLKSFNNVILVGHSFSGIYPLLFPEIENDLIGLVILNSASRPWIENALSMAQEKNLPSSKKNWKSSSLTRQQKHLIK